MTLEVMFNLYDMTPLICFVITMNNKVHFFLLNIDELVDEIRVNGFEELIGVTIITGFFKVVYCRDAWEDGNLEDSGFWESILTLESECFKRTIKALFALKKIY